MLFVPVLASFAPVREMVCKGFLPHTIALSSHHGTSDVTEEQFHQVANKIRRLYEADFAVLGEKLVMLATWDYDEINAISYRVGKESWIQIYGGLARDPHMTRDGLALVLCHEIGHYLGGFPIYDDSTRMSFEGEADYFATLKCARRFFADEDNAQAIAGKQIAPVVRANCASQFAQEKDRLICLRSSLAAMAMTSLANEHSDDGGVRIDYATPDESHLNYTERSYPGVQCRLDTFFAGFTCPVKESVARSKDNYQQGSCYVPEHPKGFRPYCWFEPEEWDDDSL